MIPSNIKFIFVCLSLIWTLSSCVSQTPQFIVPDPVSGQGAIVYIYRPDSIANILVSTAVLVNGDKKFDINNNTYMSITLPAGKHVISLDLEKRYEGLHLVEIDLADSQIYFLRVDTKMKFQMNARYLRRFDITNVTGELALTEIGKCRNLAATKSKPVTLSKKSVVEESADPIPQVNESPENESILTNDPDSRFSTTKTKNPFSRSR